MIQPSKLLHPTKEMPRIGPIRLIPGYDPERPPTRQHLGHPVSVFITGCRPVVGYQMALGVYVIYDPVDLVLVGDGLCGYWGGQEAGTKLGKYSGARRLQSSSGASLYPGCRLVITNTQSVPVIIAKRQTSRGRYSLRERDGQTDGERQRNKKTERGGAPEAETAWNMGRQAWVSETDSMLGLLP